VARSNTAATWKDVDIYLFFSNLKSQISNSQIRKFAKAPMPPEGRAQQLPFFCACPQLQKPLRCCSPSPLLPPLGLSSKGPPQLQ
jgi:hypothetical protein